ncbi:MAG: VWA domain-containing protein [Spirochaetaceae bacterium]|nr:VWA domain-containing protein [Spirochaetaceae bacterium]
MLKRIGIAVILAIGLTAATAEAQDRVDLVVLLDSSQSMFQYYNQVVDFVLSQTVKEYMRFGDAFHLISFSDTTQVEIAQVLRTEKDIRSAVARLYLLYPLGRNTDLVTALRNVYQYVADLPEGSAKHILLITDGMHSPAAGTQFAGLGPDEVKAELERTAGRVRERGWTLRIVRVPFGNGGSADASAQGPGAAGTEAGTGAGYGEAGSDAPGAGDYLADLAAAAGTAVSSFDPANASATVEETIDLPRITFPAELGDTDYALSIPAEIANGSSRELRVELTRLLLDDGTDILREKAFATVPAEGSARIVLKALLPETMAEGRHELSLEPRFADGLRVSPAKSIVAIELRKAPLASFFRNTAMVVLFFVILAVACAAILLVFLYSRRIHRKAEGPIVDALIDASAQGRSAHVSPYAADAGKAAAHASPYAADAGKAAAHASPYAADAGKAAAHASPYAADAGKAAAHASPYAADAAAQEAAHIRDKAALLGAWGGSDASRRALPKASDAARQASAETAPRGPMSYEPKLVRAGSARLTLRVLGQNPNIGKRNIRAMHSGGRASVGGGSSDFLVFLLPVPRHIAWLYYDGDDATLVPARPEFFPDYDAPIEGCLDRDIRIVTARGKELTLRFERYVPPVERINRLLRCIESPGLSALLGDVGLADAAGTAAGTGPGEPGSR